MGGYYIDMINVMENKVLMGRLIEVYRIWNNEAISDLIHGRNEKYAICSKPTYLAIRSGKQLRETQIYHALFNELGRYPYKGQLELDFSALNYAAEYYFYEDCSKEAASLLEILRPAKDSIYYEVMYQSIELIKAYYDGDIINNINEIIVALDVIAFFPSKLRQVVFLVLFHVSRNLTLPERYNGIVMPSYTELLDRLTNDMSYLPICLHRMFFLQNEGFEFDAYNIVKLINNRIKSDNHLFNVSYYFVAFKFLDGREKEAAIYYQKYQEIIGDNSISISKRKKMTLLGNEIMYLMEKKNYQRCIDIIEPILLDANDKRIKLTIFYFFCKSQLNLDIDLSVIPENFTECSDASDIEMLYYFAYLCCSENRQAVINYISILREKYIGDNEIIYIMILNEEINKQCSYLGNYKAYIQFQTLKYKPKSKRSLKRYKNYIKEYVRV